MAERIRARAIKRCGELFSNSHRPSGRPLIGSAEEIDDEAQALVRDIGVVPLTLVPHVGVDGVELVPGEVDARGLECVVDLAPALERGCAGPAVPRASAARHESRVRERVNRRSAPCRAFRNEYRSRIRRPRRAPRAGARRGTRDGRRGRSRLPRGASSSAGAQLRRVELRRYPGRKSQARSRP